jgi:hypothetical protein
MRQLLSVANRKGKQVNKRRFDQIDAVEAMYLREKEQLVDDTSQMEKNETPATYRGSYLLISNRCGHRRQIA